MSDTPRVDEIEAFETFGWNLECGYFHMLDLARELELENARLRDYVKALLRNEE